MIVTILRHGEAGNAASDHLRELTAKGIEDVGKGCRRWLQQCRHKNIEPPLRILHSPWLRTTQTATICADQLAHSELVRESALRSECRPYDVEIVLEREAQLLAPCGHILLVSHQPLVSHLLSHYLGEVPNVPYMTPGDFVCLSLNVPATHCGELLFSLSAPVYEIQRPRV